MLPEFLATPTKTVKHAFGFVILQMPAWPYPQLEEEGVKYLLEISA